MKLVVEDRRRWVLPELLRERARDLQDKPFLSFAVEDASVTYAQADELSDRLAAGLAELGVSRGDRVAVMMGNRLEFVLTWFALNKLGAFHAPINTDYRGDFLEHLVNTAGAKLMVLEHRFVDTVLASETRMPKLEELIVVGGEPPGEHRSFHRPLVRLGAERRGTAGGRDHPGRHLCGVCSRPAPRAAPRGR